MKSRSPELAYHLEHKPAVTMITLAAAFLCRLGCPSLLKATISYRISLLLLYLLLGVTHATEDHDLMRKHRFRPPAPSSHSTDRRRLTVSGSTSTALSSLYSSTAGASWNSKTNWMSGDACTASWYGVTCASGEATQLGLVENNKRLYLN